MIEHPIHTADGGIEATIDGVRMTVPDDLANRHRQMLAEWEAEGNTIAPYVEPEPDPNYIVSKATVFRRTTSQEAEALDGMIADTDARTRNIYMGAQYLDTRDELWPMLRSIMVGAFGEERTDELLAREEGA